MSHYTVAVITSDGDYESALAPFDESIKVEKYIRTSREELIKECKEKKEKYENTDDEKYKNLFENSSWNKIDYTNDETIIKTFLEVMGDDDYDKDGNEWSAYNPNSKWDWYQVGGRWCGSLKLKKPIKQEVKSEPSIMSLMANAQETLEELLDDCKTDHAQVKDIDFAPDLERVEKFKRFWEVVVEDSPLKDEEKEEDFKTFWNKNYYLKTYSTKENFVKEQTSFSTYAILYHGEWIEPNQMGWFGCSHASQNENEEYRNRFEEIMSNLNPEDWITVVDCHI